MLVDILKRRLDEAVDLRHQEYILEISSWIMTIIQNEKKYIIKDSKNDTKKLTCTGKAFDFDDYWSLYEFLEIEYAGMVDSNNEEEYLFYIDLYENYTRKWIIMQLINVIDKMLMESNKVMNEWIEKNNIDNDKIDILEYFSMNKLLEDSIYDQFVKLTEPAYDMGLEDLERLYNACL